MEGKIKKTLMAIKKDKLITEGTIVALITLWAYTTTFLYEVGQANAFGLPIDLVVINHPLIYSAILKAIFLTVVYLFAAWILFSYRFEMDKKPVAREIYSQVIPAFFIIFPFVQTYGPLHNATIFIIALCMLISMGRGIDLSIKRDNKKTTIAEILKDENWLYPFFDKVTKYKILVLLAILGTQLFSSYNNGISDAETKEWYPTFRSTEYYAAIKFRSNSIIAIQINETNMSMMNAYKIFTNDYLAENASVFSNKKLKPIGNSLFIESLKRNL